MPIQQTETVTALIRRVAAGELASFERLYFLYRDKVFRAAFYVLQDSAAAQDAMQEIFIKVWVNRGSLLEMEHFSSWFNTVIRNHLYNQLRQKAKREAPLSRLLDPDSSSGNQRNYTDLEFKELAQLVNEAVLELTPQQRLVFDLSRMQGLKHREIAEELSISPETVKKHIMDALRQVRAYLLAHEKDISLILLLKLIHL